MSKFIWFCKEKEIPKQKKSDRSRPCEEEEGLTCPSSLMS